MVISPNKSFFLLLALFISSAIFAQDEKNKLVLANNPINEKFPLMRFLEVSYEQFSASDYKMKREDQKYEDGTLNSQRRLRASVLVPLLRKKKFMVLTNLRYKYESLDYSGVKYYPIEYPYFTHRGKPESHYFVSSTSMNYFDKIWGKTIIVNANMTFDGSDKGYERMIGSVSALVNVYETDYTTLSVGAYLSTSKAMIFPIFPTLRYQHMFAGTPWVIDAIMPQYFYARRMIGKNGRLSLGFLLDSGMYFEYPGQEGFRKVYTFDKVAGKIDLGYERILAKSLILSLNVGVSNTYKGVFREKNEKDDFVEMSQNTNGYFTVGFSYNLGK